MRKVPMCALIMVLMSWPTEVVEAETTGKVDAVSKLAVTTPESLDCSFGKLRTLIGHSDFSVLGMRQNCAIFYILGENIQSDSNFNLSQIEGSSNQCQAPKPIFYKQNNQYKLLVAHKMSIYTGECQWDNSSNPFLSCVFDRKMWKKQPVKPPASDDAEVIGHTADINSDIIHVFYVDENAVAHDAMYSIGSEKMVKQAALQEKSLKKISYDSDLGLMYMLSKEMGYQTVKSDSGNFIYEPLHAQVNNFSRGSYSEFSFSNHYYLARKTLGDGRVAYYAGKEGNPEQVCIAETLPDEALYLGLFVGAGKKSAHERLRAQLSPKLETYMPHWQMTTMAMTAGCCAYFSATPFVLLILLLFIIFS